MVCVIHDQVINILDYNETEIKINKNKSNILYSKNEILTGSPKLRI